GPGAAASDVQALLRRRLRFISLVVLAIYAYLLAWFVISVSRDPEVFARYGWGLPPIVLLFVTVAVLVVVLRTRRPLSFRQLRGVELTLFGLGLADQARVSFWDLFSSPQFAGVAEWAGTSERDGTFLFLHCAKESMTYFILIMTYATLIPSDWRRCTLVVGVMAATPLAISAAACVSTVV